MIKEYLVKDDGCYVIVIRNNHYGSTFDVFLKLVETARHDFGDIGDYEINITHYSGERYKHTFGIEFVTDKEPPDDYTRIHRLESTL